MDFLTKLSKFCSDHVAEFTISSLSSKEIEVKVGFIRQKDTFYYIKNMSAPMCPIQAEYVLKHFNKVREAYLD
jgi:hypothetical protein